MLVFGWDSFQMWVINRFYIQRCNIRIKKRFSAEWNCKSIKLIFIPVISCIKGFVNTDRAFINICTVQGNQM